MAFFHHGRSAYSPSFMFYAKALSLKEMDEMKISLHFVNYVNQECDYAASRQQVMIPFAANCVILFLIPLTFP